MGAILNRTQRQTDREHADAGLRGLLYESGQTTYSMQGRVRSKNIC